LSLSTLFDDSINLDSIFFFFDTLFDGHVLDLLGVEALTMMLLHVAVTVDLLDKANH